MDLRLKSSSECLPASMRVFHSHATRSHLARAALVGPKAIRTLRLGVDLSGTEPLLLLVTSRDWESDISDHR